MNLENLLVRVGSFLFVVWWSSWRSTGKGLLVARLLRRKTDYRDSRHCGVEAEECGVPTSSLVCERIKEKVFSANPNLSDQKFITNNTGPADHSTGPESWEF